MLNDLMRYGDKETWTLLAVAIIRLAAWFAAIGLAWIWYDWRLALVIFLTIIAAGESRW